MIPHIKSSFVILLFSLPHQEEKNEIIIIMLYALAYSGVNFEMEDCREWVRSKLRERGCKPFEFVRTAPSYDPSQSHVDDTFSGMSFVPITKFRF